jgi:hypothetical protein
VIILITSEERDHKETLALREELYMFIKLYAS